jgi:hypothetical protein
MLRGKIRDEIKRNPLIGNDSSTWIFGRAPKTDFNGGNLRTARGAGYRPGIRDPSGRAGRRLFRDRARPARSSGAKQWRGQRVARK